MKVKVVLAMFVMALFCPIIASANLTANNITVVKVGTDPLYGGGSGHLLRVTNTSGSAVGTWGTNVTRNFYLSTECGDAGLATALTALALGTKIYIEIIGSDASSGSLVGVIQVSAP
jgi:hypothetical protein